MTIKRVMKWIFDIRQQDVILAPWATFESVSVLVLQSLLGYHLANTLSYTDDP